MLIFQSEHNYVFYGLSQTSHSLKQESAQWFAAHAAVSLNVLSMSS